MSAVLRVYVDERTLAELRRVAAETGRTVEDLAEAAVADAALRNEPRNSRNCAGAAIEVSGKSGETA